MSPKLTHKRCKTGRMLYINLFQKSPGPEKTCNASISTPSLSPCVLETSKHSFHSAVSAGESLKITYKDYTMPCVCSNFWRGFLPQLPLHSERLTLEVCPLRHLSAQFPSLRKAITFFLAPKVSFCYSHNLSHHMLIKTSISWAAEIAWGLKALAAFPEDLGSRTQDPRGSSPLSVTPISEDPMPSSGFWELHTWCTDIQSNKCTHKYKISKNIKKTSTSHIMSFFQPVICTPKSKPKAVHAYPMNSVPSSFFSVVNTLTSFF